MAACGSLQHLFDKTLPENPHDPFSPWKAIKNMEPVHNASFTEIFGELHHHHHHHHYSEEISPESGNDDSRRGHCKNSESFSSDNLSDDVEDESEKRARISRQSSSKRSRTDRGIFPPPISCIGRTGKPWVCFRSYREDGRFILQEIRFPTQEFLHACREDGRLRLQYIQSDEETLEGDEDEDEKYQDVDHESSENIDNNVQE